MKITGITELYSILAYDYYWENYVGFISNHLRANIRIGDTLQDFYMNCTWIYKMKTKKKSWDECDVYNVVNVIIPENLSLCRSAAENPLP